MHGYRYRGKRLLDVSLLVASAPITLPMIAITSLTVLAFDGRPILFKQERAGLDGKPFDLFKFRTMSETSELDLEGLSPSEKITQSDTARITALGRILRRTSLDELPQLLNIVRGEMSLVGPRPLFMRYNPFYTDRERLRLSVTPGLTGHSQVEHRNNGGWRRRLELDVTYAESASFAFDIRILVKTALRAVKSDNVSVIAGDTGDALDDERSFPHDSGIYMRRIYARDLKDRVKWLSNPGIREHMTLGNDITHESTLKWYQTIRRSRLRRDYAFETSDGTLAAMSGVKAVPEKSRTEFYVFVNPDLHGRRIGSIATELTLLECRKTDFFKKIWLTVRKENPRAIRIYERLGFKICDESEDRYSMTLDISA